jgi:hypothetical protein
MFEILKQSDKSIICIGVVFFSESQQEMSSKLSQEIRSR